MKFGLFYEHQLPQPWGEEAELRLYQQALDQIELADRLGIDYVWEVEHHFLEEYSHSSAPEVFLAACSQRTKHIRLGHGITLMPPNYNHPARVAERIATLDLVSNGRVEWGTGESATAVEMGGFGVDPDDKRAMWEEADPRGRQHAGDAALSWVSGALVRHAVPQPGTKSGAAAAPADVGGVLAARNHSFGRTQRARRSDILLSRSRPSREVGRGVLRHHQIGRMRADRPSRQSEHCDRHRHVLSPGRERSDPARA
jgi:alkanesulfonate monooxygenase SsuD/methylene tetrahydromethanopterin reductase-like flavin-dependent oxidoreductase (luciferase family)